MTTVQLQIPDDIAQEARQRGLLCSEAYTEMLRGALRRNAARELLEMTQIVRDNASAISETEAQAIIQAEIDAVRAEG